MSKMSYRGYKGMSMSMMSKKKSAKKEEISKVDKFDKNTSGMSNPYGKGYGNGYKGNGGFYSSKRSMMSSSMSKSAMSSKGKGYYPDDDWSSKGKGGGGSGSGKGGGSDDDDTGGNLPTATPTRQGDIAIPTSIPTAAPTRIGQFDTPAPSSSTLAPGATLAPDATLAPGATLAPDATRAPDATPEPSTAMPTIVTESPVFASCETNGGVFGSNGGNQLTVGYGYELETDPVTAGELTQQVIPALEIAFNNFLLPDLFPGICAQVAAGRRRLAVQGISTMPDDRPQFGIPCQTPKTETGNDCVYIRGQLMIFTDEIGTRQQYIDTIKSGLKLGMTNGAFNDAQESIVKVTYVEADSDGMPLDNRPTVSPTLAPDEDRGIDEASDDDRNLLLPLLLVAGAVLIVVTGVVTYRNT